ncbi:pilus assembly protein [Paenibacillus athensensis]|uniref:TadE-like domain-containing protein n=1 Tax=Paenibacillus athensensis TaxID=1967502 RepID=A0A4Y8Q9B1_9BACL|nr:TadE family protein [Paenibacillus athensensis]MCD1260380.1 pilus assembly protein [Paenibacillus athensensis]
MIKRLWSNQKGSFTIEASLVFPIVFLVTILLIFLSLYIYQKSTLYYFADLTAKRAAWSWDNSYKDAATGKFNPYEKDSGTGQQRQNDGLYWRFSDFNMLDVLTFRFSQAVQPQAITISSGDRSKPARESNLTTYKLQRAASLLPPGFSGTMSYENVFYKRKIKVHLENPLKMPGFITVWFHKELVEADASAFVTEPAEFIRNVDFSIYAGKKMATTAKSTIGSILSKKQK